MEPSKDLFQRTFSRLRSSPELRKELIAMTEQTRKPKKFILRRLVAVAAVMALICALAMGANAASGGELYDSTLGRLVATLRLEEGDGELRLYCQDGEGEGNATWVAVEKYEEDSADGEEGNYAHEITMEMDENGNVTVNGEPVETPAPQK